MNSVAGSHSNRNIKEQTLETSAKNAFVKKVYGLLLVQVSITVLSVFMAVQYFHGFRHFQQNNIWLLVAAIIVTVFSGSSLSSGSHSRKVNMNYVFLGAFTLGETYIIVFLSGLFSAKSVFFSGLLTLFMLGALTLMAVFSERDYSSSASFLVALSGLVVGLLVVSLFFKSSFAHNLIGGSFTVLLGCYLIVDTQLILTGKHPHLNYDDAITGAMILYSDLANLFMYTLVRLGEQIKDL